MGERHVEIDINSIPGAIVTTAHESPYKPKNYLEELWSSKLTRSIAGIALAGVAVFAVTHSNAESANKQKSSMSAAVGSKNASAGGKTSAKEFVPGRIGCEPIATIGVNAVAPIAWDIPNIPIASENAIPDLARGTITIESCTGNLIDNLDKEATKRTGTQTYTFSPNDIQFKLDTEKYEDGFPDYSVTHYTESLIAANPALENQVAESTANLLLQAVESQDDLRHARNMEAIQGIIADRYGSKIVKAALDSTQNAFSNMVEKAGLTSNQVTLRPDNPDGSSFSFVSDASRPDSSASLFEYKGMDANTNFTVKNFKDDK